TADLGAGRGQRFHVLDVQARQPVEDALFEVVVGDEGLERVGRGGETAGDGDPKLGEVADHLAERGVLAADLGQVIQTQVLQPEDIGAQGDAPGFLGCRGGQGRAKTRAPSRRNGYFSNPAAPQARPCPPIKISLPSAPCSTCQTAPGSLPRPWATAC